jgi:uncharacterized protein with PQ loop repeat
VIAVMDDFLDAAPIAAAAFAIPQFLPQIFKLRRTDDTAGVSWSWATLTSVNNAAWLAYFALSGYWTALVPSSSATLLAGVLAMMLARRGQAKARPAVLIGAWAALLAAGFTGGGRTGLGVLLTAAFVLQVTPPIWTAYRTARPTGISQGTWLLIFGELSCWTAFGVHKSDPRLIILGFTGVAASLLMLARIRIHGLQFKVNEQASTGPPPALAGRTPCSSHQAAPCDCWSSSPLTATRPGPTCSTATSGSTSTTG